MAHDVFISHSSEDKLVADALCAALEGRDIRCWVAPRDIPPGGDWANSIVDALGSVRVMVLVFSKDATKSQHVKKELAVAVNNRVVIVPVKIDETPLEGMMEYHLTDTHWLEAMGPPSKREVQRLATAIEGMLVAADPAEQPEPTVAPETRSPTARGSRRWVTALGILAALVAVGLGLWLSGVFGQAAQTQDAAAGESNAPSSTEATTSDEEEVARGVRALNLVNSNEVGHGLRDIEALGDLLLIAAGEEGLYVLDASDPAAPTVVARYTDHAILDVAVDYSSSDPGDVAYAVPTDGAHALVMSFSDPARPTVLAEYRPEANAEFRATSGVAEMGMLYLVGHGDAVVNIADPANPTEISHGLGGDGRLESPTSHNGMIASVNRPTAGGQDAIHGFDSAVPGHFSGSGVNWFYAPDTVRDIALDATGSGQLFVSRGDDGIDTVTFEHEPGSAPHSESNNPVATVSPIEDADLLEATADWVFFTVPLGTSGLDYDDFSKICHIARWSLEPGNDRWAATQYTDYETLEADITAIKAHDGYFYATVTDGDNTGWLSTFAIQEGQDL